MSSGNEIADASRGTRPAAPWRPWLGFSAWSCRRGSSRRRSRSRSLRRLGWGLSQRILYFDGLARSVRFGQGSPRTAEVVSEARS